MPFIGNTPAQVPLTSADIADGIITSAKIVDGTITNSDVASSIITGQTAETSIAGGDSVLIYDDSASALRKMTRTNFVAGVGGVNTPAFHVTRSSNQSIGDNSFDKIQLNSELFDTDNCFDSTTNYRFTPTTAGKYFIYANVTINSNGDLNTLEGGVRIYKNGSIISDNTYDTRSNAMSYTNHYQQSQIIDFNGSSDYVEMYCFTNDSSGTPTVVGDSTTNYTYFGGFKIIGT